MKTILFVDNDANARKKHGKLLENAGFAVRLASNPAHARSQLKEGGIDLAVIDVRLADDDDESDVSGLELARDTAFSHIPKIILTGFPLGYDKQRSIWKLVDGEPPAVLAVVHKKEKPQALLNEISSALDVWPRLAALSSKVAHQIRADHYTVRSQARWHHCTSLVISLLGFLLIAAGIAFAYAGSLEVGIVGAVTGLILQAVGYLFYTQLNLASHRMDLYHRELLQTYWLEILLSVVERLPADRRYACIEQVVDRAAAAWYPAVGETDVRADNASSFSEARSSSGRDLLHRAQDNEG